MKQILLIILLTGCSTFTARPYEERVTEATIVTWITVDDIQETCKNLGIKDPGPFRHLLGCVKYSKKTCRIYTEKITSMEILGHELRHCFEGKFHE
jgi:hypothetical protein